MCVEQVAGLVVWLCFQEVDKVAFYLLRYTCTAALASLEDHCVLSLQGPPAPGPYKDPCGL